jgi:hypothetical protein
VCVMSPGVLVVVRRRRVPGVLVVVRRRRVPGVLVVARRVRRVRRVPWGSCGGPSRPPSCPLGCCVGEGVLCGHKRCASPPVVSHHSPCLPVVNGASL